MVMKNKRLKQGKFVNEDMAKVRTLAILLVIVVLISVGLYFLTDKMIEKETQNSNTTEEVNINYDIASIGTMFNRIEEDYYVLIYSSEDNGNELDSVLATYRSGDNYKKTYFVDLDLKINNSALGDKVVKTPKNSNEVRVNDSTLYRIKGGKVIECYVGTDDIKNVLK